LGAITHPPVADRLPLPDLEIGLVTDAGDPHRDRSGLPLFPLPPRIPRGQECAGHDGEERKETANPEYRVPG
jgi:hypothetical protein